MSQIYVRRSARNEGMSVNMDERAADDPKGSVTGMRSGEHRGEFRV
jgi:hypothetical protein